jgi:hypothetical protein
MEISVIGGVRNSSGYSSIVCLFFEIGSGLGLGLG